MAQPPILVGGFLERRVDTRRLWIWSRNRMFSARTSFHSR